MTEAERQIFADAYNFYKKHRNASTDEDWRQAIYDMAQIDIKHNAPLCRNLIIAVVDSLPNNN